MPDVSKIMRVSPETIQEAAGILTRGGLVAFPTDTVYGLAANALDGKAVAGIFEAKGRPADKPLIIFVATIEAARKFAKFNPLAEKLAGKFWPGALTLVLDPVVDAPFPENVTAGFKTLAIRVPKNPAAMALVQACPFPLAVTSVNVSGAPSPATAAEIKLGVDLILDGGDSEYGIESTVLDARGKTPVFLRDGATSRFEIDEFLGASS